MIGDCLLTETDIEEASYADLKATEIQCKEAATAKRLAAKERVAELKAELGGLVQRRGSRKSAASAEETPKKKKRKKNRD